MDVMGDKATLFETGRFVHPSDREETRDETGQVADEAVEEVRRRLAAEDGDVEAMSVLGAMLLRRGDLDGAEPHLRAATAAGDRARAEALAAESFDRGLYPEGVTRQLAAMLASGPRADGLRALELPTLVIHGLDDTLIQPDGGERTAELIPGARLMLVEDMGHDRPEPLWPVLTEAILLHTEGVAA